MLSKLDNQPCIYKFSLRFFVVNFDRFAKLRKILNLLQFYNIVNNIFYYIYTFNIKPIQKYAHTII